jgi:hypothetical protein
MIGGPDAEILERASAQGHVVVTHDLAFGRAAIRGGTRFVGIIYLRPGHISAEFVLEIVDALRASTVDVQLPFIAVAGLEIDIRPAEAERLAHPEAQGGRDRHQPSEAVALRRHEQRASLFRR